MGGGSGLNSGTRWRWPKGSGGCGRMVQPAASTALGCAWCSVWLLAGDRPVLPLGSSFIRL